MIGKPEDVFDVVDEMDTVIGCEVRSVVHAQGLKHRAVHILVWNAVGKVLLQERSARKDNFPLKWDSSCSGHVDSGEDYLTAAQRELEEELGIRVQPSELIFELKIAAREETGQEFVHVYRLWHEGPFVPCPEEIDSVRWYTEEEVSVMVQHEPEQLAPALRYLWNLPGLTRSR
jgi:isopentenyl-diphosphate Delta-isomerase